MAELKTKVNESDVLKFINHIEHKTRKEDSLILLEMMKEVSGEEPKMWGESIIGFGTYHYKYEGTGREGDWMRIAFSPRKQNLSIYLMNGYSESTQLLNKLGKHKIGKACLYINKLKDVDLNILKELMKESIDYMNKNYPKI